MRRHDLESGRRRRSPKGRTRAEEERKDRCQHEATEGDHPEPDRGSPLQRRRRMIEEPEGPVGGAEPREEQPHGDEWRRTRDTDVRHHPRTSSDHHTHHRRCSDYWHPLATDSRERFRNPDPLLPSVGDVEAGGETDARKARGETGHRDRIQPAPGGGLPLGAWNWSAWSASSTTSCTANQHQLDWPPSGGSAVRGARSAVHGLHA
jgi:hypothetical protein